MPYPVRTIGDLGDLGAIPEPGQPGHAWECSKPWNWAAPECNRGIDNLPSLPSLPSIPSVPDPARSAIDLTGGDPPTWAFVLSEYWGPLLVAGAVALGGGVWYVRQRRSKRR